MEQNTPLEKNTMESAPCGFSIAMNKAAVSARTAVRRKRIIRLEEKCKSDRDSLAVEILIHAYMDTISEKLEENAEQSEIPVTVKRLLEKLCGKVQRHTDVIDCGEKEVDSNRLVFDGLSMFHESIYRLLE